MKPHIENAIVAEAERLRLESEIVHVEGLVPQVTGFSGPPPTDWETYANLPERWREQIRAADPGLPGHLRNLQILAERLAAADAAEVRRLEILGDLPVKNIEQFNALSEDKREGIAMALTDEQRAALLGEAPRRPGFLGEPMTVDPLKASPPAEVSEQTKPDSKEVNGWL